MIGIADSSEKPYLLRCQNLTKTYRNVSAVKALDFTSYTSFLGLLGPNGSGKSTLLKLMLGLINPDQGLVEMGVPKDKIRMVPDFPVLPENLTIEQWMDTLEKFYGPLPRNIDLETDFRLIGSWKLSELSVGQKRLASLMPIFYGNPQLMVLDEPTNFLDVIIRQKVLNMIKEQIQNTQCKVLIASHRIDEIELLASEIIMLNRGELIAKISLKHDYRLGFNIRVSNLEAFEQYLKNYKIEYNVEDTLLGKVARVQKLNEALKPISDFNRDGGFVFNISAVNNLQERLGELK